MTRFDSLVNCILVYYWKLIWISWLSWIDHWTTGFALCMRVVRFYLCEMCRDGRSCLQKNKRHHFSLVKTTANFFLHFIKRRKMFGQFGIEWCVKKVRSQFNGQFNERFSKSIACHVLIRANELRISIYWLSLVAAHLMWENCTISLHNGLSS